MDFREFLWNQKSNGDQTFLWLVLDHTSRSVQFKVNRYEKKLCNESKLNFDLFDLQSSSRNFLENQATNWLRLEILDSL